MRSKIFAVSASVAVLAALFLVSRRSPEPAPARPRAAAPAPAQDPMKSYRVYEEPKAGDVLPYRGAAYNAEVRPDGLRFEAGGHRMSLGARRVEQGGAAVDLVPGVPAKARFAAATIERAEGITEEFIFENRRAEHLVRLEKPLGKGELVVRVAVDTNLSGPVREVPRGQASWKDVKLEDGGLVFTDASGTPGLAYHGAVAIDAAGRRQEFDPRWENGEIALKVPASFMDAAAYPVLIDPWLELDQSGSLGGISLTGTVSETPAIAQFNGSPSVAWSDASNGNFEIFFRYWNGVEWVSLGEGGTGGGVSNTRGKSSNPSIGDFTPAGTSNFHPFIAWEDDSEGSVNIYVKGWTGTSWSAIGESATSSGISRTIGTPAKNPQAVTVLGLVDNDPAGTVPDRVEFFPCVVYEIEGIGIIAKFFYPGDNRQQAPPPDWYFVPAGGSVVADPSATRASAAVDFQNQLIVAYEASNGGTQMDIFCRVAPNAGRFYTVTSGIATPTLSGVGAVGNWALLGGGNVCVGLPSALSIQPSVAVDGLGDVWVAWQESVGAEREIYVRRHSGGVWGQVAGSSSGGGVSGTSAVGAITTSSFPSIAVNESSLVPRPVVAWEDDVAGNSEIFVRRLNVAGTAWSQVADEGSAQLVVPEVSGNNGGISRTTSFSLRPRAIVAPDGRISVAWRDGALGTFDLFLRRYYDNAPTALTQESVVGAATSPLAIGQVSGSSTVRFSSILVAESATQPINLRLQVEVRPNTAEFTQQITHESLEVPSGGLATIDFTGLPNVNYHWRARSIDAAGRSSPWVSVGGNLDGEIDFRINSSATGGPANTGTGLDTESKDKCGLTGLEVFALLGLGAALRRRRRV